MKAQNKKRAKQRHRTRRSIGARPRRLGSGIEALEGRLMFSASPYPTGDPDPIPLPGIYGDAVDGSVVVHGSSGNDEVSVYQTSSGGTDYVVVNLHLADGSTQTTRGKLTSVPRIKFYGFDGADRFENLTSVPSYVEGGAGSDRIKGGSGDDVIYGGSEVDYIYGKLGDDEIHGGSETDYLYGGAGVDEVHGNAGDDYIYGGGNGDTLYGDMGQDTIYGYGGADVIYGGADGDTIYGGAAEDTIDGGSGVDHVYGQLGDDVLSGGSETDYLYGGDGADMIHGDAGADFIYGGKEGDILYGDGGGDTIYGYAGDDWLDGGAGNDTLRGGSGDDTIIAIDNGPGDTIWGNGEQDSFWVDGDDDVRDADSFETQYNLHEVASFENGADKTLDGDDIADPSDGVGYVSYAANPLFAVSGPSVVDIGQHSIGDCWLLAAMGSIADADPNAIYQTVVSLGDGTFAVRLGGDEFYRVDADLPTTFDWDSWDKWYDPTPTETGLNGCLWSVIIEKAYADYYDASNTYESLNGGWIGSALKGLNASDVDFLHLADLAPYGGLADELLFSMIAGALDGGCPVVTLARGATPRPRPDSKRHTPIQWSA